MGHLVVVGTPKSLDDACRALEQASAEHRFGVLHIHDARETLASKRIAFEQTVRAIVDRTAH